MGLFCGHSVIVIKFFIGMVILFTMSFVVICFGVVNKVLLYIKVKTPRQCKPLP